jgi:transposase
VYGSKGRLKDYRAIATRFEKTAQNFLAGVYLAAAISWLD